MIQRIQTVHLLIAAALVGLFIGLANGWLAGLATVSEWLPSVAYGLAGATALATLVSVFLYKQRLRQRKVVGAAMALDLLLVLFLVGVLAAESLNGETAPTAAELTAASVLLLPVLAYAFLGLARRGVRRDNELVRSMDRLR